MLDFFLLKITKYTQSDVVERGVDNRYNNRVLDARLFVIFHLDVPVGVKNVAAKRVSIWRKFSNFPSPNKTDVSSHAV